MKIAAQMDPIGSLRLETDTTLPILLEMQARGHELFYYTPDRMSLVSGSPYASMYPLKLKDQQEDYYILGEKRFCPLEEMDIILMRQDPPFDMAYITSTFFLERISHHTLVVNDPRAVRDAPEKLLVTQFSQWMPPTLISRDIETIELFYQEHEDIVMKPLYGHGGASVFKLSKNDPNMSSLLDWFSSSFKEPWVVQKFMPEIALGDKRIFLIDGKPKGAINRIPQGANIRSNMARGGKAFPVDLSKEEEELSLLMGEELVRRGIIFAGMDMIGGKITEMNVTSPTGLRAFKRLAHIDLVVHLVDVIERKYDQHRQEFMSRNSSKGCE